MALLRQIWKPVKKSVKNTRAWRKARKLKEKGVLWFTKFRPTARYSHLLRFTSPDKLRDDSASERIWNKQIIGIEDWQTGIRNRSINPFENALVADNLIPVYTPASRLPLSSSTRDDVKKTLDRLRVNSRHAYNALERYIRTEEKRNFDRYVDLEVGGEESGLGLAMLLLDYSYQSKKIAGVRHLTTFGFPAMMEFHLVKGGVPVVRDCL